MFSEESLKRLSEIRNRICIFLSFVKKTAIPCNLQFAYKDFGIFQLPQMCECTLVNRPLK